MELVELSALDGATVSLGVTSGILTIIIIIYKKMSNMISVNVLIK